MPTDQNNDRYPVPVSRGGEPYDQHINTNFDALATEVPASGALADRPAADNAYAPKRYYATDEGVEYWNTGSSWTAITTAQTRANQAGLEGHIVPVGSGLTTADAVDINTSGAINTAINKVYQTGLSGHIILPPTEVTQNDSIRLKPGVSIYGAGIGVKPSSAGSLVTITDSSVPLIYNDSTESETYTGITLSDFHIRGQGEGTHTANAIQLGDPAVAESDRELTRGFHIARLYISDFAGSLLRNEPSAYMWASRLDFIIADRFDPGVGNGIVLDFRDALSVANHIGTIDAYPIDRSSGSLSDFIVVGSGGDLNVRYLNIGGAVDAMMRVTNQYAVVNVQSINYEIHQQESVTRPAIVDVQGEARVRVGVIHQRSNAPITSAYLINGGYGYYGPVDVGYNKSDPTNSVEVTGDSAKSIVYEGMSADVANNSGTTLSPGVSCLGDLTLVT